MFAATAAPFAPMARFTPVRPTPSRRVAPGSWRDQFAPKAIPALPKRDFARRARVVAAQGGRVVAIDIDAGKLAHARHNARLYGVEDRIDFVLGDATVLLRSLDADVVFLSPPWGGPDYADDYDIASIRVGDLDGNQLLSLAARAAPRVAYYLPRTTSVGAIAAIAAANGFSAVDVESNFINGKFKAKTAYFGAGFAPAPPAEAP